jgi:tetratricopeptide (TPR) repeat protein
MLNRNRLLILAVVLVMAVTGYGCASLRSLFAFDPPPAKVGPIHNPFDYYTITNSNKENIILRTKKGDRSVEVELPGSAAAMSEFVIPVSPAFRDDGRSLASDGLVDERYRDRVPSMSDREITNNLPQAAPEHEGAKREIETSLGLLPTDDSANSGDKSYLATMDHIKQLYKTARYEAALMELDDLIRLYPTDAKLYQMRGTLFDRSGRMDLAVKSWNQAVRLDPNNQSLRKFVERKQQKRSLASP